MLTANPDLPVWELGSAFDELTVTAELTTPTDIKRIWTAIELGLVDKPPIQEVVETPTAAPEVRAKDEDSRAAILFEALLLDAVSERASDIHLENYETGSRVRFRIDGSLVDVDRYKMDSSDLTALVNVIKVSSRLDISERRLPQGGRVRRRAGGRVFDLRVQTQPTLHQESVVIRILPQDQKPPTVEDLGFTKDVADRYRRLLRDPNGLILVVGQTGSGKSTTLYAGLQLLAKDTTRKVLTIEDPIEFSLPACSRRRSTPQSGSTSRMRSACSFAKTQT